MRVATMIGRVGVLALTLGVGVSVAAPAHAEATPTPPTPGHLAVSMNGTVVAQYGSARAEGNGIMRAAGVNAYTNAGSGSHVFAIGDYAYAATALLSDEAHIEVTGYNSRATTADNSAL